MTTVDAAMVANTQIPTRSLEQRFDALARANVIRSKRAQLKRDLKAGRATIDDLLKQPPDWMETARVFDFLLCVQKIGRVKANKLLRFVRVSPTKTFGGLSARQRGELRETLRGERSVPGFFVARGHDAVAYRRAYQREARAA